MIFNKLINELQIKNLQFNGELITPNYFRILTDGNNITQIIPVLKIFNYNFLNSIKNVSSNLNEIFFNLNSFDRDFLISLVIPLNESSEELASILNNSFSSSLLVEKYFSGM